MRVDLVIHTNHFLLHLIDLSFQLGYVTLVLLSHADLSGASLLQNQICVLNVLQLLGLGLLLQSGVLAAIVFYLRSLSLHDFDLIERDLQLLVEGVNVHEFLI